MAFTKLFGGDFTTLVTMTTCDVMEFSKKLKALMKHHRYSQTDVASNVDVSQSLVSLWVNGKSVPSMREAVKLAKLLGVDVEFLADDAKDAPPPSEFSEWERSVIELIRAMKLDRNEVWSRLAGPGESAAPVVLTGQAARDAIAASQPGKEPPIVVPVETPGTKPKSGPTRRKA